MVPPTPAVAAQNLTRRFGSRYALRQATFTVPPGEIVGLVGPNGAGKSTTFRLLLGQILPDAGRAQLLGLEVTRDPYAARAQAGFLPEEVPLPPELRVVDFLELRARLRGLTRRARRHRVAAVLEALEIRHEARTLLGHLSRGYRQRVGLAAALVHDPPVLFLDEPTVGLDPDQRLWFRRWVRGLSGRRTVLLSSHELLELERVCDRFLILKEGHVVAAGTLPELWPPRLLVAVKGGGEDWPALFRRLPGVRAVQATPTGWRLEVAPDADPREALVQAVQARGGVVVELAWARPDLETLYAERVGGVQ